MIRSRPTISINADRDDLYTVVLGGDPLRTRAARYCACGTRLRRSQPMWVTRCDPCQHALDLALPLADLHPEITVHQRPSDHTTCPDCGGRMHKRAQRCKTCRSAWVKAQKHPVWPGQ
jgi:predicted nucleic acid-binding Zn ribbon protein